MSPDENIQKSFPEINAEAQVFSQSNIPYQEEYVDIGVLQV
jgi:hypothetical protein